MEYIVIYMAFRMCGVYVIIKRTLVYLDES